VHLLLRLGELVTAFLPLLAFPPFRPRAPQLMDRLAAPASSASGGVGGTSRFRRRQSHPVAAPVLVSSSEVAC
jgi:hypothetical protein